MFRFEYTGIRVRDLNRSLSFYRDGLGLRELSRGPVAESGGEVALLECPASGRRLELNAYPSDDRFAPPYREGDELDHLAFAVADVFSATDHLRRLGATVKVEPPGAGKIPTAFVLDPDGIWIELRPGPPSQG